MRLTLFSHGVESLDLSRVRTTYPMPLAVDLTETEEALTAATT